MLYFDITFEGNTFYCKCTNNRVQANEHTTEKLSPGFTFTLLLCQSTTTQPKCRNFSKGNRFTTKIFWMKWYKLLTLLESFPYDNIFLGQRTLLKNSCMFGLDQLKYVFTFFSMFNFQYA